MERTRTVCGFFTHSDLNFLPHFVLPPERERTGGRGEVAEGGKEKEEKKTRVRFDLSREL